MQPSKTMRLFHRWVSIAFTLTVTGIFAILAIGEPPEWVYYLPLLPLALLLLTGLYLFALPYFRRGAEGQARTEH